MKTVKVLKTLINILFFGLIAVIVFTILLWIAAYFSYDSFPFVREYKILHTGSSWKLESLLMPFTYNINYVLFTLSIFYLRKSISFFIKDDSYSKKVTRYLKKSGNLFLFIGLSTILIQVIMVLYLQSFIHMKSFGLFNMVFTIVDLKSAFIIIMGLFLLLFSKNFENARKIKQENELTI